MIHNIITGWPAGGRANSDESAYYTKKADIAKTILIFAPHPDDDVIIVLFKLFLFFSIFLNHLILDLFHF